MESVRVRVVFEDRRMLSKAQRKQGLRRSWLLLRPEIDTVESLVSYIIRTFHLRESCPNGLLLSLDEFVLPSFESIQIFRDGDIVSVLASTEFENESGGYESEDEDNVIDQAADMVYQEVLDGPIGSKRKRSLSRPSSSKKKNKKTRPDDSSTMLPEVALREHNADQGISSKINRPLQEASTLSENNTIEKDMPSTSNIRHVEGEEGQQTQAAGINAIDFDKKVPSRSARRKKAKRQWLRELKNKEQKETDSSAKHVNNSCPGSPVHREDHESDSVEDFVPVVIRPGHIRFGPAGQDEGPASLPEVNMKWNGTVNKRKGQKWGREDDSSDEMMTEDVPVEKSNTLTVIDQEKKTPNCSIDFANLPLLNRLPERGDVIAYKVVELSSSWCPELSSFRVGKVRSFDPISSMIVLDPVPDHPITNPDRTAEDELPPEACLYTEDGSLESDLSSLHDVRLFGGENPSAGVEKPIAKDLHCNQSKPTAREQGNVWDELSRALEQKKEELSQKKLRSTGRASWSLRALRRSALGPTVSLLRSNNEI
ncbi:sphere organelles protein-like protein isoform X2 [Wolffia australiana]